jgi:hypothetical protein
MSEKDPPNGARLPLFIALASALVPFVAVQIAYLLAAGQGQVDWCNPYIDSCTSISATGRRAPAAIVFKGAMLPSAVIIGLYWWLHARWLQSSGAAPGRSRWMLGLGVLACIGLALYVSVLDEAGDVWRLQRKIGTILFFSFTFLAQLLLAASLREYGPALHPTASATGRWMLGLCLLMLALGVFSVIVQAISEAWHDAIEDAIEWQLALLLQLNFLLTARLWWRTHWQLGFLRGPA